MTVAQPAVLIALGSNIEPEANLPRATALLAESVEVVAASPVYRSPPVGAPGTPEFLNAVVLARTDFGPRTVKFGVLRDIETRLGRRRTADRNAPRTIDLDLILHGDQVVTALDLELPDPALVTDAHVAVPAADVAADVRHPVAGTAIAQIAAGLESRLIEVPGVVLLAEG